VKSLLPDFFGFLESWACNVLECDFGLMLDSDHVLEVFLLVEQGDTNTFLTGSTSTTCSVNERLGVSWWLKLNNQSNIIDIKSS